MSLRCWAWLGLALFTASGAVRAQATDGAALYATHCARCHGVALEGQPDWRRPGPDGTYPAPPHDATGHTWHHSDRLLFGHIEDGGAATLERIGVGGFASGMPAFGGILGDAEIRTVLDFIKSRWPERERRYQAEISRNDEGD